MIVHRAILVVVWMSVLTEIQGRHIQRATQRNLPSSRPRVLVIRPPEGSGQPKRIVVISGSRPSSQTSVTSQDKGSGSGSQRSTGSGSGASSAQGLDKGAHARPVVTSVSSPEKPKVPVVTRPGHHDRSFGGHPQSAARHQASHGGVGAHHGSSGSGSSKTNGGTNTDASGNSNAGGGSGGVRETGRRTDTGSSTGTGATRSLRDMLEGLRSRGQQGGVGRGTSGSNIVNSRVSDHIPRAAIPSLPNKKGFGDLNMPTVIEAALRKIQQRMQHRQRAMGNVREPGFSSHGRPSAPGGWDNAVPAAADAASTNKNSPFHGGVIDLSAVSIDRSGRTGSQSGHGSSGRTGNGAHGHEGSGTSGLGSSRVSPSHRGSPSSTAAQGGSGRGNPFMQNNDILRMNFRSGHPNSRRTGSNLRTFEDKTLDTGAAQGSQKSHSTRTGHVQTTTPVPGELQGLFDRLNLGSMDALGARLDALSSQLSATATGTTQHPPTPPAATHDNAGKASTDAHAISSPNLAPTSKSGALQPQSGLQTSNGTNANQAQAPGVTKPQTAPVTVAPKAKTPVATLNQTAKLESASANTNSTSNTTSTKSVKTKTIKVTTVVKGGGAADVAAAAASQAEIANAVAQGKDLSSSNLADIAAKANSKVAAKAQAAAAASSASNSQFPVGSITVKRQQNGDSIITLSDGTGEPVVLRASGPVKIERIVKPNGKIQFLINPVRPITTQLVTTAMMSTIDPGEVELEDITTTVSPYTEPQMVTKMVHEALSNTVKEITGSDNKHLNDAVVNVMASSLTNAAAETTTKNVIANGDLTISGHGNTNGAGAGHVGGHAHPLHGRAAVRMDASLNADIMQLFPLPKIPPPPRILGSIFGDHGHLNKAVLSTVKPAGSGMFHVRETAAATPKPDVMPKYDLVTSANKAAEHGHA